MSDLATATKGSEVRVPEFFEDGTPTDADDTWGTVRQIAARGWAKVEWGGSLVDGVWVPLSSYWLLAELEVRCICCKQPLGEGRKHTGVYHVSCGRESDNQERAEAKRYKADVEATDRAFPRHGWDRSLAGPVFGHRYDVAAERGHEEWPDDRS